MINELISAVSDWNKAIQGESSYQYPISSESNLIRIPTLLEGHYEAMSPMLYERYNSFANWLNAPHGDWLSLEQMKDLWQDWDNKTPNNTYATFLKINTEQWENDAIRLFRPGRISVFAASLHTYDRIYLLWFDGVEEPELWLYDSGGLARFKDLSTYLKAILTDDSSAYSSHWILGYDNDKR